MVNDSTLYDAGPPDSHCPTLSEIGAALALVIGAVCVAVAVVVDRRWKA